jgi:hypothetical protein
VVRFLSYTLYLPDVTRAIPAALFMSRNLEVHNLHDVGLTTSLGTGDLLSIAGY